MGQYYLAVNEAKKEYLLPHDYDNGLKLMEHSYLGNSFVLAVESLMGPGGRWEGDVVRWEGDYNDAPAGSVPAEGEEEAENLYHIARDTFTKVTPPAKLEDSRRYVLNATRSLFIDTSKVQPDKWDFRIHPMPLMLADANGRGGGDYNTGTSMDLVGSWAGDLVYTSDDVPAGYAELVPGFVEG